MKHRSRTCRFKHFWSEVIRFTPVAFFLVALTFIVTMSSASKMSAEFMASAMNTMHDDSSDSGAVTGDHEDSTDESDATEEDDTEDHATTAAISETDALQVALEAFDITTADLTRSSVHYNSDEEVYKVEVAFGSTIGYAIVDGQSGTLLLKRTKDTEVSHDSDSEDTTESDDASSGEGNATVRKLVSEFPDGQQKIAKRLIEHAEDNEQESFASYLLSLNDDFQATLLTPTTEGNNPLAKHALHILEKEGLAGVQEFLTHEQELHDTISVGETVRVPARLKDALQGLLKRIDHFDFPSDLADTVRSKVKTLVAAAEAGTLTESDLNEFRSDLQDLMERAREIMVQDGTIAFKDVNPSERSDTFDEDVAFLKEQKITTGYSDGTFRPDAAIRRDEYLALVFRAAYGVVGSQKLVADADLSNLPSDVSRTSQFARLIAYAYEHGIAKADTFGPERSLTRAEAVVIAARVFDIDVPKTTTAAFADTRGLDSEFKAVINKAATDKVISGIGEKFYPGVPVTRGQAAKILHHAIETWETENL